MHPSELIVTDPNQYREITNSDILPSEILDGEFLVLLFLACERIAVLLSNIKKLVEYILFKLQLSGALVRTKIADWLNT
ncbi:hypothetical protein Gasu2_61510 [Galdieria sulphuraria]|uniref:Uncharacterized protein n=1 Tax=Galdieria sulphuraria TaxID=130081 RepID=M2WQI2_GALSU|nr:uncharacterized protein Gasu_63030 [Galdieria sulphuraria]EME26045.1 hypothetical protein Gasu_63030 [Galdieria sulphuraria]GJD12041.1 hypothetical protein Gasu2_61510 [Galdieria sulphuraria]|eukprot:XP_005702565.1 hypothetical protein Gasu_63030 [Galdieria sulphuraria]